MFGPNKITNFKYKTSFSHRTEKFKNLFKLTTEKLKNVFNLQHFDVLFVPGSGTTAMEVVMESLKGQVSIQGHPGKFKSRWENFLKEKGKINPDSKIPLFCQLETSTGEVFNHKSGIVDAISSFPYYDIPEDTRCFVTCSNKQLGAFPGLGIIFVRKDSWGIFCEKKEYFCTRDINLYKEMSHLNQTPTTCPVQIFAQLNEILSSFDLEVHRNKIDQVCKILKTTILEIENKMPCPVANIKKNNINHLIAKKYEIYNHNKNNDVYQIFTYSNKEKQYKALCEDLKSV